MRVPLDRDLLKELPGECYAVFEGEWGSDEPEGWETFRVMLLGIEAGDYAVATIEDLRRIVRAVDDSEEVDRCETHRCDAIPRLGGQVDRCWKGEFVRHLSIADCSMVRALVTKEGR